MSEETNPRVPGYLSEEDRIKLYKFLKLFEQSAEYKGATDPTAVALEAFKEWEKKHGD